MSMHKVLIVDDDADDREMTKDAFASASSKALECHFLEDGDKLIDYLYRHAGNHLPSLILLDLNMPGKDGRETLRQIKNDDRFQHIPVLIFSTSSSHLDKKMAYDLGANCFITKPDTFNQLTELARCFITLWLQ
jgi:CheY-like chemotaxis protein